MHSKTRIAALIAAVVFGAQVGVAAIEDAKPVEMTQAVEQRSDTLPAEPAAAPEPAAVPEAASPSVSDKASGIAKSAASAVRGWYDRFVIALGNSTPPPVFPEGANGDVETWLMPTQIAYFEQLEQRRLASLQPQAAPQAEIQPAAAEVRAQAGSTDLVMAHDAAASAMR